MSRLARHSAGLGLAHPQPLSVQRTWLLYLLSATMVILAVLATGCGRVGYDELGGASVGLDSSVPTSDSAPPSGPVDASQRTDAGGTNADSGPVSPPDATPGSVDGNNNDPNLCTPPCGMGQICCSNQCVSDNPAPC